MADIAPQPFINYGQSIAQQGLTQAQAGQAQAQTGLTQQQTAAASMENQIMRTRMPLILSALNNEGAVASQADTSGVAPTPGGGGGTRSETGEADESGTPGMAPSTAPGANAGTPSFYQPDVIDQRLRSQFYVPQYTQQEMQGLRRAYLVDPQNKYGLGPQTIVAQHDMRVAQQTQASELGSRNMFDVMHAVVDAPSGSAMSTLESMYPDVVGKIRKEFAKDPNADVDEDAAARQFAAHVAGAVHQYTGRKAVKDDAGVYRDEATGISVPGIEKVGMSTQQWTDLAKYVTTPSIDMPDGQGGTFKVAPWKAAQMQGAHVQGPDDYLQILASHGGVPGAASTLSPNSAPKQIVRQQAKAGMAAAQAAQDSAGTPTDGAPPPNTKNGIGTARNAQGNVDPTLTKALQDPEYDYVPRHAGQPYKAQVGHAPPSDVTDDMKNQTSARASLRKETSEGLGAAQAAQTMYRAAQDVLAKGNYNPGAWNQELAKYSRWLPSGWQSHMTGDYQEVAKYLGQAALQAGKGIFQKMTQQEAGMLLNNLNPSAGMQPEAVKDMINKGSAIAQYTVDSAKRAVPYVNAGKDANSFYTWNAKHYPQAEAVANAEKSATKSSAAGKPDAAGYIPGRLYPGANGTKARYMGNGQWQPQ